MRRKGAFFLGSSRMRIKRMRWLEFNNTKQRLFWNTCCCCPHTHGSLITTTFHLFSQCTGEGKYPSSFITREMLPQIDFHLNATSGTWSSCFLYKLIKTNISYDVQLQLLFSEAKVEFVADVADALVFWSDIFHLLPKRLTCHYSRVAHSVHSTPHSRINGMDSKDSGIRIDRKIHSNYSHSRMAPKKTRPKSGFQLSAE